MSFSFVDRKINLQKLKSETFDLVIIGGGINGAGMARDAALRGMRVALVEANDFASGTSSRSSKLIHGGIRYLENLEFHLVFEALNERQKLFEMAPHLVHPLRFMIPLYKSSRVNPLMMGLGMWLYDALSLFQAPEMHEHLDYQETTRRMPVLKSEGLKGSFVYSDAYMDDDRLTIETLRSAHRAGAVIVNYCTATGAETKDGAVVGIKVKDQFSKDAFSIFGKHVVSTVGPWTDELGHQFFKEWKNVLRPTKGVHLTFEKKRFPLSSAVVMGAEKRIVFGIPRHEMVIVGTTDTDFKGSPSDVTTDVEDVRYLLGVVHDYFPGVKITKEDIVASYAGVRPLVHDGSETEGKTSREHTIWTDEHRVSFVAGGKYTTYRLIAEQAVNHCLRHFRLEDRARFLRSQTATALNPLVTTESFSMKDFLLEQIGASSQLSPDESLHLGERHGQEAIELIKKYGNKTSYVELEALHAIENTMCTSVVDFYTRRSPLVLSKMDHGLSYLDQVAQIFAREMDWSEDQTRLEKEKVLAHIDRELGWQKLKF